MVDMIATGAVVEVGRLAFEKVSPNRAAASRPRLWPGAAPKIGPCRMAVLIGRVRASLLVNRSIRVDSMLSRWRSWEIPCPQRRPNAFSSSGWSMLVQCRMSGDVVHPPCRDAANLHAVASVAMLDMGGKRVRVQKPKNFVRREPPVFDTAFKSTHCLDFLSWVPIT